MKKWEMMAVHKAMKNVILNWNHDKLMLLQERLVYL